jgi:hypothetical protein
MSDRRYWFIFLTVVAMAVVGFLGIKAQADEREQDRIDQVNDHAVQVMREQIGYNERLAEAVEDCTLCPYLSDD